MSTPTAATPTLRSKVPEVLLFLAAIVGVVTHLAVTERDRLPVREDTAELVAA
jgi:hypothetical protein